MQVCLCREVSLLDTSLAPLRHSFFLNEAREQFAEVTYQLNDLLDLEKFWFDLQSVCLRTDMIIS